MQHWAILKEEGKIEKFLNSLTSPVSQEEYAVNIRKYPESNLPKLNAKDGVRVEKTAFHVAHLQKNLEALKRTVADKGGLLLTRSTICDLGKQMISVL